jgi:hypothetical protein
MIIQAKKLAEFFKHTDIAIGIIDDNNANRETSAEVTRATESAMACYKEYCSDRQEATSQQSLHYFFESLKWSIHWLCKRGGPA